MAQQVRPNKALWASGTRARKQILGSNLSAGLISSALTILNPLESSACFVKTLEDPVLWSLSPFLYAGIDVTILLEHTECPI